MQKRIYQTLTESFNVKHLTVENDSHRHATPNPNSHFKVLIVSNEFVNLSLVKRHQKVHQVLSDVMKEIHALQLNTYTLEEWLGKIAQKNDKILSSQCVKT